jgi:hypothetical protein
LDAKALPTVGLRTAQASLPSRLEEKTMNRSFAAFLATVAIALGAAANQPEPVTAPLGAEASLGWSLDCQHVT